MMLANANTNVRTLYESLQQEQRQDVRIHCTFCGRYQTAVLIVPGNQTQENDRDYDPYPFEDKSLSTARQVPIINVDPDRQLCSPFDFHYSNSNQSLKSSIEPNIQGFVDNCIRSSINELTNINKPNETQDVVEVEVEYDPILGNVKSTRKRSSTIITKLDDYPTKTNTTTRHSSMNPKFKVLPTENDHEKPIWARRRVSHSTVKPSDLIREFDKKEKLEANAYRRLSRADLAGEEIVLNSTKRPTINSQNPVKIKDIILRWCQDVTQYYKGVNIHNFSTSWADGLAFCAIIHRYFPDEFNFDTLSSNEPRQNFDLAFTVALERAGIEPLIETEDMLYMGAKPDWKVVFTYVQSLYRHLSRVQPPAIMRERW